MSNFPDPLVVHVLLLTHEFMYIVICLPHFWYPQCDSPCFSCAQNTQIIPPLQINAVGWSWQMLDCLYSFNGATCRDSKRRIRGKKQHNLQQQYTTYCRLRIKQFKKEKADEMVGLIDTRSPKVYELMTAIKCTDISPIPAESWTEHLQSHFVHSQESAPDLLPGQFNLPARHQLLSGQLRSGQILPSDIAVPPGPGGRYRNMNTTFQRSNERAPVYELQWLQWLQLGVTFSQVVWLIGC